MNETINELIERQRQKIKEQEDLLALDKPLFGIIEAQRQRIAELESETRFFREQCPGAFVVYQRQHALLERKAINEPD